MASIFRSFTCPLSENVGVLHADGHLAAEELPLVRAQLEGDRSTSPMPYRPLRDAVRSLSPLNLLIILLSLSHICLMALRDGLWKKESSHECQARVSAPLLIHRILPQVRLLDDLFPCLTL